MGTRKQTPDILGSLLGNPGTPKAVPAASDTTREPLPEAAHGDRPTERKPEAPPENPPAETPEAAEPREEVPKPETPPDPSPAAAPAPPVEASIEPADGDEAAPFKGHFVAFRVGQQRFAFPLDRVERVVRMVSLTPVPEAPAWISGLFNLHGKILPVISLRKRLGLPSQAIHPDDRILVMNARNRRVGLIAEAVDEVMEISEDQWVGSDESLEQSQLLEAVIRRDEDVYLVLSADEIGSHTVIDLQQTLPAEGVS